MSYIYPRYIQYRKEQCLYLLPVDCMVVWYASWNYYVPSRFEVFMQVEMINPSVVTNCSLLKLRKLLWRRGLRNVESPHVRNWCSWLSWKALSHYVTLLTGLRVWFMLNVCILWASKLMAVKEACTY